MLEAVKKKLTSLDVLKNAVVGFEAAPSAVQCLVGIRIDAFSNSAIHSSQYDSVHREKCCYYVSLIMRYGKEYHFSITLFIFICR